MKALVTISREKDIMETRWLYTTSENFTALREAAPDTCVIPIGCNERIYSKSKRDW